MKLFDSHCMHLYGSQAWQFTDRNVYKMVNAWNRAIRKIWKLPNHSHRVLLCGLNEGKHIYDHMFTRFMNMFKGMCKCGNAKLSFISMYAKYDKRSILAQNIDFICKSNDISQKTLLTGGFIRFYSQDSILEHEQTISMIVELNRGIPGFSVEETKDMLYYISTA